MKDSLQIEGQKIFDWVKKCDESDLGILKGTDFSNATQEWTVVNIDREWIDMTTMEGVNVRKRLQSICDCDFFIDVSLLEIFEESRRRSMSPAELAIEDSRHVLQSRGFNAKEFTVSEAEFLASLVLQFQDQSCPDKMTWQKLQEIIQEWSVENKRAIVPILEKWIKRSELNLGVYDLSRRILLAAAYRHTGQPQKAIDVSDVVNEYGKCPNDQGCIAILCTIRAASLMDIAETASSSPCQILAIARKSLNRANAIRSSDEIMSTYRRMKVLDQRFGC